MPSATFGGLLSSIPDEQAIRCVIISRQLGDGVGLGVCDENS